MNTNGARANGGGRPLTGIDELNFAEFPLSLISTTARPLGSELIFEDETDDEGSGQRIRRKLTIAAPATVGLPLPRDNDVFLVMARQSMQSDDSVLRRVPFRRGEFLEVLRWDDSGQSYRRLDESLRRWTSVTLNYTNAWWVKSRKRFRTRTFHVLDEVELAGGDAAGGGEFDGDCWFTWGDTIYRSLCERNVRSIDLDLYFRFKKPAARQAYRFLGKRFWHRNHWEFELRAFCCEHLGFSRNYDVAGLKRVLLPVLDELAERGFIEPACERERFTKVRKGAWLVQITGRDRRHASPIPGGGTNGDLMQMLTAHGISGAMARRLVTSFPVEQVRGNLAYAESLLLGRKKGEIRRPAGFIIDAIKQDYRGRGTVLAVRTTTSGTRQPTPGLPPANKVPLPDAADRELECKMRQLESLAAEDRAALEQAAMAAAAPFHRSALERLQRQGGNLLEELRTTLIADFLRKHPTWLQEQRQSRT